MAPLFASTAKQGGDLTGVLRKYGYDSRLICLTRKDLPRLAEIYVNGQSTMARLVSLSTTSNKAEEPKVEVELLNNNTTESVVIDLGQITTVWEQDDSVRLFEENKACTLPDSYVERQLDTLYRSRVGRGRHAGPTKKQVTGMGMSSNSERVLRQTIKAGKRMERLVDSAVACQSLYESKSSGSLEQRACAATYLARDARLGGRFKRWPCLLVDLAMVAERTMVESITILNGGWLVVDLSSRAGTEARKFVERSSSSSSSESQGTLADERIVRRLECLAMGELFAASKKNDRLELDVREVLTVMKLPPTPDGAKTALTRIGRWTVGDTASNRIQFWPKPVLEAAAWYVQYSKMRRSRDLGVEENRVVLTNLPCISVDAKRVAFRDDAIGVRPRAGTGRKLVESASKWEILLHVADVSDIYTENAITGDDNCYMSLLRSAAESRGTSRYDLPSGPLHLLPPVVLKELSLRGDVSGNRCVTLWVYIDERNGRLLDAGIERSLVAPAIELSFLEASNIMDNKGSAGMNKAKAVLLVVERNLNIWSQKRIRRSEFARKRENRLSAKESEIPLLQDMHDDGRDGFFRSRGHRLVDAALSLYAYALSGLLRKAKAPIPRARGADASRGGRIATSPLRRAVDGQAQKQALAVCCEFGERMTERDCRRAGTKANEARNAISNIRATKK